MSLLKEEQIKFLIKYPEIFITKSENFTEDDWKQIYNFLLAKRMDQELYESWLNSQKNNGMYKYKAIGQLFARFATINRGFKTLKKSSFYNNEGNSI